MQSLNLLFSLLIFDASLQSGTTYSYQHSSPSFLDVFLKWKLNAVQRQMKERLRLREELSALQKQRQGLKHNFMDLNGNTDSKQETVTQFRYNVNLDRDGNFQLLWDIDPSDELVTFRLKVKAHFTDVVGFGFSDYGESENADFLIVWTDVNRNHYFTVSLQVIG